MRETFFQGILGLVFAVSSIVLVSPAHAQPTPSKSAESDAPALPVSPSWRTFAKPLAVERSALLLFQRNGTVPMAWRVDWKTLKTTTIDFPEIKLDKDGRYTALASEDGLWLLGNVSLLIRRDDQRLTLDTGFNEPVVVVLDDRSVLVLGSSLHGKPGDDQYRMWQLSVHPDGKQLLTTDRGALSYDGRHARLGYPDPVPRYGHSAVKLRDGRVLLLGGDRTPKLASVIEPRPGKDAWSVKPVAPMPHGRVFGAATLLPDGRVVVTGAPHLGCYGAVDDTRSVDIYDVQNNRWAGLPPLPFVPCADAYGADTPSIATTPNGSIVVGAHLEPQVMVLPRDANSPTGYAASWQVYGRMPLRRISGVVQALSDSEVIVAGGVDNPRKEFGGCCYATADIDRIDISRSETADSLAMGFLGAGAAKRGLRVFAASGRRFGFTGSGQMRYSALAELIDLATGKVRQLPNVPFASGATQAFWLDDDRVLLKGIKESSDRGFEPQQNVSSYMPPSSGAMAIYYAKEDRWGEVIARPELERAQVIAAEGNEALLLSDNRQALLRMNVVSRKLEPMQQPQHAPQPGSIRVLPRGKVLLEGEVQSETISVLDPECEAAPGKDCPERFAGFGPYVPMTTIEALSVANRSRSTIATLSAAWPANEISTVITAQIRAIVLTWDSQSRQLAIARSSANGASWDSMPLPPDLVKNRDDACGRCMLTLVPDPRDASKELMFLRQGAVDADNMDDAIETQSVNVWWWNEAKQSWHHVLQNGGITARSRPLALGEPLSSQRGKRMMSMGWHLGEPLLWMEP